MSETHEGVIHEVERYYSEKLRIFGPTPRGVDWRDAKSQKLRFDVLLRILEDAENAELLDFGCGYGALLDHPEIGAKHVRYEGRDVSATMVSAATQMHQVCGVQHHDFGFSAGADIAEDHDVIVASGIFNVKMDISEKRWSSYIEQTIALLAARSRRGFAYNCLSDRSDSEHRRGDLHYASAGGHASFIAGLGFEAEIVDGYGLYEFTIIGRR